MRGATIAAMILSRTLKPYFLGLRGPDLMGMAAFLNTLRTSSRFGIGISWPLLVFWVRFFTDFTISITMTGDERLSRIRTKIDRAKKHLIDLEAARNKFIESEPYVIEFKVDSQTGNYLVYLTNI